MNNIVSGRVSRHARSDRHIPNWLKAVYASVAALVVTVALSLMFAPEHIRGEIPACKNEDGSGQTSCYWDADTMGNGRGTDFVKVTK